MESHCEWHCEVYLDFDMLTYVSGLNESIWPGSNLVVG